MPVSAVLVVAAAVVAAHLSAAPKPGIEVLNVNGTGCRRDTVAAAATGQPTSTSTAR